MTESIAVGLTGTPIGQYGLDKAAGLVTKMDQMLNWLEPVKDKRNCNGNEKGLKELSQNDHTRKSKESLSRSFQYNSIFWPLKWIICIPVGLFFIWIGFIKDCFNILLLVLNRVLHLEDVRCTLRKWQLNLKKLQAAGLKNRREKQIATAERLKTNPPEMNIICRTFSKWPLKLFVKRLRKILNFLGIITLPLTSDLKQNGNANNQSKSE